MISDLPTALWWYFVITAIGIIFLPITSRIFKNFFDQGYALSKILGILLASYTVWLLGSLKILPFTEITIFLVMAIWLVVNWFFLARTVLFPKGLSFKDFRSIRNLKIFFFEELLFLLAFLFWVWVRGHEPSVHGLEKFMDFGFMNSILRTDFFPPQDMWLAPVSPNVNQYSGGFFINYYYYGHYATAFLMKLTGILPEIAYNLMLSTVFGLCFSASFSIGYNLFYFRITQKIRLISKSANQKFRNSGLSDFADSLKHRITNTPSFSDYRAIITGLLSAALVTLAGNLHTIYLFTSGYPNENPEPFWKILEFTLNPTYWYPNATRFIPNTIHEFPSYSWVVADLHGHVLDIPFVLLTIALLLSFITHFKKIESKEKRNSKLEYSKFETVSKILKFGNWNLFRISDFGFRILLLGLLTAVMYMTNAWDGVIYLGLGGLTILAMHFNLKRQTTQEPEIKNEKLKMKNYNVKLKSFKFLNVVFPFAFLLFTFFLFSLPFNRSFVPFVHGIGVVGGWEMANALGLIKNTAEQAVRFGPFLLEKGNNLRSPLWMLAVLWGFFYFNVIVFLIRTVLLEKGLSFKEKIRNFNPSDLFVLLMILISTALLVFPEFFYMKDIYPGHYRANTMFKLGYQAFIMLSIVSAYVITRYLNSNDQRKESFGNLGFENSNLFRISDFGFRILQIFLLVLVLIYPYYSIQSYYGAFGNRKYEGQNGMMWLKNSHPGDYKAILWFRELNPKPYPLITILEAVGDSYTDYARISANTGIPTPLGWPVHEWLWRGSYDEPGKRVEEVKKMYESPQTAKDLFEKYKVQYVVIGDLERQKYTNINEDYFEKQGKVVFSSNNTKVYQLKI